MVREGPWRVAILFFSLLLMKCNPFDPDAQEGSPPASNLIAHRGAAEDAPENTLPAIDTAWKYGADAVEIDVRMSKDGRVVVIHDSSTARTTGRKLKVAQVPYDSLAELDAGRWFAEDFKGTRIPLLDEILDRTPPDKELLIEVKSGPRTIDAIEKVLSDREAIPAFSIISFQRKVLLRSKELFPRIPAYWNLARVGRLERCIRKAKEGGVNGLNLYHQVVRDASTVKRIKGADLQLLCWTINDTERARSLLEMGVDGIVTDRVGAMKEVLRGRGAS